MCVYSYTVKNEVSIRTIPNGVINNIVGVLITLYISRMISTHGHSSIFHTIWCDITIASIYCTEDFPVFIM